jgi:ParB family chromosome partitioning protein
VSRAGLVSGVVRERSSARGGEFAEELTAGDFWMDLEFHQLDMRYEHLRLRRPQRERRLLASLAEKGQQVPIVVVALFEDQGRYQVIDGHKRVRLLQRLGADTVQATVWDMSEAEALLLDRSLRAADAETAIEQGWLLQELRNLPLSHEDLAKRFDRSVSWVSKRLALVQVLPQSVQEHIRAGRIPAQAAIKYLVPLARANREDCEVLSEVIAKHHLTSREVGELYRAWREGSWDMRRRVLEDPELFLRAQRELEESHPVEVRAADGLLRDLELVGRLARRAERRWREGSGVMEPKEREEVRLCLEQAREDLARLARRIDMENGRAEPERADGDPGASREGCREEADCADAEDLAPGGPEGHPVGLGRVASAQPGGKGRAAPDGDLGALRFVRGESGPGP